MNYYENSKSRYRLKPLFKIFNSLIMNLMAYFYSIIAMTLMLTEFDARLVTLRTLVTLRSPWLKETSRQLFFVRIVTPHRCTCGRTQLTDLTIK